jgi:hypothetical protein
MWMQRPDRGSGADGRIRTGDLLITNQLLYQLSYISVLVTLWGFEPQFAP